MGRSAASRTRGEGDVEEAAHLPTGARCRWAQGCETDMTARVPMGQRGSMFRSSTIEQTTQGLQRN